MPRPYFKEVVAEEDYATKQDQSHQRMPRRLLWAVDPEHHRIGEVHGQAEWFGSQISNGKGIQGFRT
jgi:hypothetical protein